MLVLPLRRELDAETMRWLREAWLRREFRRVADEVVKLEAAVALGAPAFIARKLPRAQARLSDLRSALAQEAA